MAAGYSEVGRSAGWQEVKMAELKLQNKPPSPVLPLPPLEYDIQYMNNLIRLLNFFIKQIDNPGILIGSGLQLADGDEDTDFLIDLTSATDLTKIVVHNLPTSATGLVSGQVWNNAGVLSIVP